MGAGLHVGVALVGSRTLYMCGSIFTSNSSNVLQYNIHECVDIFSPCKCIHFCRGFDAIVMLQIDSGLSIVTCHFQ
jgi:hypothetical protein